MQQLLLKEKKPGDWAGKFPTFDDFDYLLTKDTKVLRPDGSTLLVLKKKAIPIDYITAAWQVLGPLKMLTNNRGTASGQKIEKVTIKKDGTISNQKKTAASIESSILGFFGRNVRFPYCRPCAFNLREPTKFARLLPMVQTVSNQFAEHVPERYAVQKAWVDRTSPDFVIPGSVFTTLTVNKNFRTACHQDAGDLEAGFSALSLIRQGKYEGGYLVLPEWRIAVALDTGDLALFQAHEWHGNTEITKISPNAVRCTVVYYYRENMIHCGTHAEELERAKTRQRGEPLFDDARVPDIRTE